MLLMPPRKPNATPPNDRHKPAVQVRIPANLSRLLQEVADAEVDSSVAEQVKTAVRFYLKAKGKIPSDEHRG